MWEKVVLNLLSNALKFTFDGAISVRVGREGSDAVVTISDTGIGVAAEEMPRLFERFHRIESARARSNEGSGIGLALVQELVGLHGGTITAESVGGCRDHVLGPVAVRLGTSCRRRGLRPAGRAQLRAWRSRMCKRRCAGYPATTKRPRTAESRRRRARLPTPGRRTGAGARRRRQRRHARLPVAAAARRRYEREAVTDGQQALARSAPTRPTWSSAT